MKAQYIRYCSKYNLLLKKLVRLIEITKRQLKYGNLENDLVKLKTCSYMSDRSCHRSRGRIQPRMNGLQTSLSRQKIHIIRRCIPCQAKN